MTATCIVADLGGTFLRCALVSNDDSLLAFERIRLPGSAVTRRDTIWNDIVDAVVDYARRHSAWILPSAKISFAFPGPVCGGMVAAAAPTVLGGRFAVPDVRALLADRTRRDVLMVNDVSAAAWYFSGRVAADRFVVVTISSGIGAKLFDRRHPLGVLDDVPYAGEIGHLVVDDAGVAPICDCGGRGHLGAFASARGFERIARVAAARDPDSFTQSANVARFGATAATLCNELHLVPALRAGDRWSRELLRASIRPLATVLRTLCVGSGLDGIVLMGGFVQALGEAYRSLIADAIATRSDGGPARIDRRIPIVLALEGEEPSLLGAAAYARMNPFVS